MEITVKQRHTAFVKQAMKLMPGSQNTTSHFAVNFFTRSPVTQVSVAPQGGIFGKEIMGKLLEVSSREVHGCKRCLAPPKAKSKEEKRCCAESTKDKPETLFWILTRRHKYQSFLLLTLSPSVFSLLPLIALTCKVET